MEQTLPNAGGRDVINAVRDDMEARARKGVQTYGRRLETHNGRNALIDAYQESLDLAIYLKQELMEQEEAGIDHQYQHLLRRILNTGTPCSDRTGTGTRRIFGHMLRHDMSKGFPLLTTKNIPFDKVIAELLWFLRGDTRIDYLHEHDCHIWDGDLYQFYVRRNPQENPEQQLTKEEFFERLNKDPLFRKYWGDFGPIYPKQWRGGQGYPDQISNVIDQLKNNPDNRRILVDAWNPRDLQGMALPPCHVMFQFSVTEVNDQKTLSLVWIQRSVDTFLGLPFNIASYATLLELVAREVDMVPGELVGMLTITELYNDHLEAAELQASRIPKPLPKLILPDTGGKPLLEAIYDWSPSDFAVDGYMPHPRIKANLSN